MSFKEFYPNGYGISVINNDFSYGTELAVLKGTADSYEICYDTPITDDVVGHLDDEGLELTMIAVKDLPSYINNHSVQPMD